MFSKLALFAVASMAVFVAAVPTGPAAGGIQNSCNSGPVQCCNSMQKSSDPFADTLKSIVGVALGPTTGDVGLTCSPIGNIAGGNSCSSQPVCCENNHFDGVVATGCNPINIKV